MTKGQSFIKNIKQLEHIKSEPNKGSKSCDINHVFKAADNQFLEKTLIGMVELSGILDLITKTILNPR